MLDLIFSAALALASAPGSGVASPAEEEPLLLEERRLGTLPEGLELGPGDGVLAQEARFVAWSPNGRRFGFVGRLDGKVRVGLDGELLRAHDWSALPAFSADSSTAAVRVGDDKKKGRIEWSLLVDGRSLYEEDWIGSPMMSPDGERIAFWTQPGARSTVRLGVVEERFGLVVLERKGRRWKERESPELANALVRVPPIHVGGRVFGAAWLESRIVPGTQFVANASLFSMDPGEKRPTVLHDLAARPSWFAVDASGERWGWTVFAADNPFGGAGGGQKVLVDGVELESDADELHGPYFSPLDERYAVRVAKGDLYAIAVDGAKADVRFEYVDPPVFGAGGRLAFVATEGADLNPDFGMDRPDLARDGGDRFVVRLEVSGDGAETEWQGARWREVRDLTFSPDGERLAYVARSIEGWQVVVDGLRGPVFDHVGAPRFSADSSTLVHGAAEGSELWWRVWAPVGGAPAGSDD